MMRCSALFRSTAALAVTFVWLGLPNPAAAQKILLISSAPTGNTPEAQRAYARKLVESRLSPELHAVVAMNGEFKGFTKLAPALAARGGNPYRAIIVAKAPVDGVPLALAGNEFFKAEAAPLGLTVPAAAETNLQVSYRPGEPINERELREAGFSVVAIDGKPQLIDLGKQGGVITVKPTEGSVDKTKVQALERIKGLKFVSPVYPAEKVQQAQIPEKEMPMPIAAVAVNATPANGILEPNEPHYANITDPSKPNLWGLRNINAPKAWAKHTDASNLIVAVIDTGVAYDHVDLADTMWVNTAEKNGRPGVDDDNNGYIDDLHGIGVGPRFGSGSDPDGHGTHCAGTIGGVGDNGKGVVGVCWRTKIMGIRFIGSSVGAVACVKYAVDNGAAVLSNSWTQFDYYDPALEAAIEYAKDNNVLFIAAAANDNKNNDATINYPSSYENDNLIAVGAINKGEKKADFSNWGKTRVDLFAPGVDIWSTTPGNFLKSFQGTSMACPHVAGACALVWSHKGGKSGATWNDVRSFILGKARKVPALTPLCVTGATLDIGEMDGVVKPPLIEAAGVLLAADTFTTTDNIVPAAGVLRVVKITLAKPMIVVVDASFDFQANGADATFTVSVGTDSQAWTGAVRDTGAAAGKATAFAMHAPKKLEAGIHTIAVRTTANSGVKFGAGAITVVGFPVAADTNIVPVTETTRSGAGK